MFKKLQYFLVLTVFLIVSNYLFAVEELYRKQEDDIIVDSGGNALIQRTETVSVSPLSRLYNQHWHEFEIERSVQENFLNEVGRGYFLLLGFKPERSSYKAFGYYDKEEGFRRKLKATVVNLARQTEKKDIWEIDVKQVVNEDMLLQFFEFFLDGKVFESMFLKALKGEQVLRTEKITSFMLPPGSKIRYGKKLSELEWDVDFGGGNKMKVWIELTDSAVVLHEEIKVSEEEPELLFESSEKVLDQLRNYADFTIRYELPGSPRQTDSRISPPEWQHDWSNSWSMNTSKNFFFPFSYNDSIEVEPSVEVSFDLGAFLGWKWHWEKISGPLYRPSIEWFETYIKVNPSINIGVEAYANKGVEQRWTRDIIRRGKPFTFWVSTMPVVIVLEARIGLGAEVEAKARMKLATGIVLSASGQLGAKWNKSEGKFIRIREIEFSGDSDGMKIEHDAEAFLKGEIIFGLSALAYNIAGPYVEFKPFIEGNLSLQPDSINEIKWEISGGYVAEGGLEMSGWLKKYIGNAGLPNIVLLSDKKTLKTGTWPLKK